MENKMKKLIALFAVTTLASTTAIAGVAISGAASVSYDDNGSATASETTYDADLSFVGTTGGTTVTVGMDVDAGASITGVDMSTKIGPMTIAADMFDATEDHNNDGDGDYRVNQVDTGVTVSLDAPIGDATVGLDNSGNVSVSGTFSGVTISHTIKNGADKTVGSASIAGMDITLTNDAGATDWKIGTTVSGVAVTLSSGNDVTATFGLTGNTMTISRFGEDAAVAATATDVNGVTYPSDAKYSKDLVKAYTTVAISRSLTSGATLSATYKDSDESLTLKAAVAF
jgi:hypothetical protein